MFWHSNSMTFARAQHGSPSVRSPPFLVLYAYAAYKNILLSLYHHPHFSLLRPRVVLYSGQGFLLIPVILDNTSKKLLIVDINMTLFGSSKLFCFWFSKKTSPTFEKEQSLWNNNRPKVRFPTKVCWNNKVSHVNFKKLKHKICY